MGLRALLGYEVIHRIRACPHLFDYDVVTCALAKPQVVPFLELQQGRMGVWIGREQLVNTLGVLCCFLQVCKAQTPTGVFVFPA